MGIVYKVQGTEGYYRVETGRRDKRMLLVVCGLWLPGDGYNRYTLMCRETDVSEGLPDNHQLPERVDTRRVKNSARHLVRVYLFSKNSIKTNTL